MSDTPEPRLDVVYVLQDFPVRSEQFVVREISGLQQLGARVRIIALRNCEPGEVDEPKNVTIWRPPRLGSSGFLKFWFRAFVAVFTHPRIAWGVIVRSRALQSDASRFAGFYPVRWLLLVAGVAAELVRDPPSIIHAHFASGPATVALLLGYSLDLPWGFSAHAHDFYAQRIALPVKVAAASHVFACSGTLASDMRLELPVSLHDRIHIVFHGIDLDYWRMSEANEQQGEPLILGVGRFEPKKGFALLIDACAMLIEAGYPVRCELIGDGSERDRLADSIASKGLADVIRLVPWCSAVELRSHYRRASVLAVPSLVASDGDRDNIPNVLVEAMACGVPVVAAAQPAMREVLSKSRAGVLFEPQDTTSLAEALRRVSSDETLATQLRTNGLKLAREQWDVHSTSRRAFDLLESG